MTNTDVYYQMAKRIVSLPPEKKQIVLDYIDELLLQNEAEKQTKEA